VKQEKEESSSDSISCIGFDLIVFISMIIICSQAENKFDVIRHCLLETIFHKLLNMVVTNFGLHSPFSIIINLTRNIVWATNAIIIQIFAGKKAQSWLWCAHCMWAIGAVYPISSTTYFLFWIVFKISECFMVLHLLGFYSLHETLAICFVFISWIMASYTNIEKLKLAQKKLDSIYQQLCNQYNQYKSLLTSISDVILKVDRNYNLEFMRNAYILSNHEKILDDAYIGKSLWSIIKDPAAQKIVQKHIDLTFTMNKPIQWTWYSSDSGLWFSGSSSPLVKDHQVVSATVLISDITEKVISERRRREREEAEIKLKAKSEFISSISHELRNPLQAISFSIELLSSTKLQKEQRDLVINIQESSSILSSIIGQILDYSKIESGKMEIKEVPFNVLEVIETVSDIMHAMALKKGLKLITFVDPRLPQKLLGDATKIIQILNNLISNAIKFTTKGHVALSAELESEDENFCTV